MKKNKPQRKSISLHKLFMLTAESYVDECSIRKLTLSCCLRLNRTCVDVVCSQSRLIVVAQLSEKFDNLYKNYSKHFPWYWEPSAYEERVFALLLAAEFYKDKRIYYYE